MPPEDPTAPHETPQDPVEIRQDATISIQDVLVIAAEESLPIGKSTLQRWAKSWADQAAASPVKCVLVTNRSGSAYRLDRDDFKVWLFDHRQNMRPGETAPDPEMRRAAPRTFPSTPPPSACDNSSQTVLTPTFPCCVRRT